MADTLSPPAAGRLSRHSSQYGKEGGNIGSNRESGTANCRYKLEKMSEIDLERQRLMAPSIEKELEELHQKYKLSEGPEVSDMRRSKDRLVDSTFQSSSQAGVSAHFPSNDSLLSDTAKVAEMSTNMAKSFKKKLSAVEELSRLQEQARGYMKKIENEKKRTAEVEAEIDQVEKEVAMQRKTMGGVKLAEQENLRKQKQVKVLEEKISMARVKFNEAGAYNKELRQRIDNLRRERVVFDGVYRRLEKELDEKKAEMAQIVEVSNAAYDARAKAKEQMEALKVQAEQEQMSFEEEWGELGKLIEHDSKMKEYVKQRNRAAASGQDLGDEEERLRKRIMHTNPSITKDKAAQQQALEKVQKYEEAFARIQQATGITDIDELVATFIEAEDQNFSLFNYVNELNNEVEKLEVLIAHLRAEIERHRGQAVSTDSQRRRELQELEEQLIATEKRTIIYESKARRAANTIAVLKQGIHEIFESIGCNQEGVQAMMGGGGVTEGNVMQYLGVIEQRTNEILQMYAAVQLQQHGTSLQDSLVGILGQGPSVSAGSVKIHVTAPSMQLDGAALDSEGEEEDEEEDRPLTRQELRAKAMLRVQRASGGVLDVGGEMSVISNMSATPSSSKKDGARAKKSK